jgi:Ca2+-binding RTX toxin-like protein
MRFLRFLQVVTVGLVLTTLVGVPTRSQAQLPAVECFNRLPTQTGTADGNRIRGTAGNDVLVGLGGDDIILGLEGTDRLCGNDGNDTIFGGLSAVFDRIDGGPGDDRLAGREEMFGPGLCAPFDAPVDFVDAFNGIYGGTGNDDIVGASGTDALLGGEGNDCVIGIDGNDVLTGGSGGDVIGGGPGQDFAEGGDDFDLIFGQGGNDKLYAASADVLLPQFPPNTCRNAGEFPSDSGPIESGSATSATGLEINFLVGDVLSEEVPNPDAGYDLLVGSNRVDHLAGDARGDDLYGFGGADQLAGGRASDCLSGGADRDVLDDGDQDGDPQSDHPSQPDDADTLWGGRDHDTLNGLDGDFRDSLDGGRWSDVCKFDFVFPSLSDSVSRC